MQLWPDFLRFLMYSNRWCKLPWWPDSPSSHCLTGNQRKIQVNVCLRVYVLTSPLMGLQNCYSEQQVNTDTMSWIHLCNLCQKSDALFNYNLKLESPAWRLSGRSILRPESSRPSQLYFFLSASTHTMSLGGSSWRGAGLPWQTLCSI